MNRLEKGSFDWDSQCTHFAAFKSSHNEDSLFKQFVLTVSQEELE